MKIISPSAFKKLSKGQKAILVAKDVIEQIKLKNYDVEMARGYLDIDFDDTEVNSSDSARDCLIANKLACEVCARGAAFLSAVKFKNKLTVDEMDSMQFDTVDHGEGLNQATEFMADIFSVIEQELIESTFEESIGQSEVVKGTCYGWIISARNYGEHMRFSRDSDLTVAGDRLIKLMRNVIVNGGYFIVPRKYFASHKDYEACRAAVKTGKLPK